MPSWLQPAGLQPRVAIGDSAPPDGPIRLRRTTSSLLQVFPTAVSDVQMTAIYVDADACPVREEVYRVASRLTIPVYVVSNGSRPIRAPGLVNVEMVLVPADPDAADDWIAEKITATDLCATADIPLAARCLARGARVLAFNGREWTDANIGGALAGRALAQHLRETGIQTGGPSALTARDRASFLNTLDRLVHAARRAAPPPPLTKGPQ